MLIIIFQHLAIFKKLNGERGTGSREWGQGIRLTIYHKTLHSEEFRGAESIDGNSFL